MLTPLNNTIPVIATIAKGFKTNDFCKSLLLVATNIQTKLNIINKPTSSFQVAGLHTLVYCILPNPDRCYFFTAEILTVQYQNLQLIKTLPFHSKKHIRHKSG